MHTANIHLHICIRGMAGNQKLFSRCADNILNAIPRLRLNLNLSSSLFSDLSHPCITLFLFRSTSSVNNNCSDGNRGALIFAQTFVVTLSSPQLLGGHHRIRVERALFRTPVGCGISARLHDIPI